MLEGSCEIQYALGFSLVVYNSLMLARCLNNYFLKIGESSTLIISLIIINNTKAFFCMYKEDFEYVSFGSLSFVKTIVFEETD